VQRGDANFSLAQEQRSSRPEGNCGEKCNAPTAAVDQTTRRGLLLGLSAAFSSSVLASPYARADLTGPQASVEQMAKPLPRREVDVKQAIVALATSSISLLGAVFFLERTEFFKAWFPNIYAANQAMRKSNERRSEERANPPPAPPMDVSPMQMKASPPPAASVPPSPPPPAPTPPAPSPPLAASSDTASASSREEQAEESDIPKIPGYSDERMMAAIEKGLAQARDGETAESPSEASEKQ